MLWSCQILDEQWRARPVPNILLARAEPSSSVRRARIEGWPGPEFFFGGKRTNSNLLLLEGSYTRIFNIAVCIAVPWHSRSYSILPDFGNCLFLVHMNNAALNFVLSISADFREPFILFAASLKIRLYHWWWQLNVLVNDHDGNWM